jgi:uncharacterized delta-60 repeat protein
MTFFAARNSRRSARAHNPPRAFRPRLEALEDRSVPSAGALDPAFGNGGIVTTNLGSPDDEATNIFVQPDGKLLVVGFTQDTVHNDYALTLSRYQANGNLDTYGSGGTVITGLTSPNAFYPFSDRTFAFQPDDSLVILWGNEVTRYKSDGSLDTGFGTNGIVTPSGFTDAAGNPTGPNALALQSNGQILLAGGGGASGIGFGLPAHAVVERLNPDGSLDTNFGQSGTVAPDLLLPEESFYGGFSSAYTATAVAVLPNGGFVIGGSLYANEGDVGRGVGLVARFNADGSLDTTFGLNVNPFPSDFNATVSGKVLLDNSVGNFGDPSSLQVPENPHASGSNFFNVTVTDFTVQPDGNLLVGLGNGFAIVRLTQSGMLDPGLVSQQLFPSDQTTGIAPFFGPSVFHTDATGGILVMSLVSPQDAAGNFEFAVNRYNPDGTPDLTFGSGGSGAAIIDQSASSYSDDFAVQSDGKIVLAGATWDATKQGWDMELMRLSGSIFTPSGLQDSLTSGGTVTLAATSPAEASAAFAAVNSLNPATTPVSTVVVNLGGQTVQDTIANVPPQVTLQIVNGTFIGGSPALIVQSGQVIVQSSTFSNATDAPTILVSGGSLTLRNDIIQESTGFSDAAISITGGTVDLGTTTSTGGNTINVNGAGSLVTSTLASAYSAVGDTFENNGVAVNPFNTTTLTASANPSLLNQPVTFTATINPAVAGAVPSGTVQFQLDGANVGAPVVLNGGSATFSPSNLTLGAHTITAIYSGDANYITSFGTLAQNVQYHFSGFLAPLNSNIAMALNRTVPIKFQLTDYNDKYITSLSAVQSLTVPGGTLSALRYDSTANQFIANWQTKGLPAGTYTVTLALADGTTYTKSVTLSKNGSSAGLTTTSAGGTGTAVGALLGGDVDLYVDNGNGDLTADELARIQDAVTAADAVTEPYGVAVTEVSDPTLADVRLNMDTTSAVGGYADGVLGCTTDAGQITLINGWNFYAGSDATGIGSGQYDFETVVTHELGHALGLGHSTDSTSVMYATLNTGAVNRTLTTADLNVADSDTTGACGLHAAVIPMPVASNVPLLNAPSREAFFAMLAIPAHAPAVATNTLAPSAYDAVFANPTGDIGTARFAALSVTPIFGATATLETANDSFSLSPEDGAGTPPNPSAPPTDRPDLQFDFIPADGAIVVEC